MSYRIYIALQNDETGKFDLFVEEPDGMAQRAFHRGMSKNKAEKMADQFTETERMAYESRRQSFN